VIVKNAACHEPQASEEFDVETLAKNIVSQTNFEYGYAYDLLDGYTTVRFLRSPAILMHFFHRRSFLFQAKDQ